jgi:hypothetical protein
MFTLDSAPGNFTMVYPKKIILISCPASYIFNEIYKPIIEENFENWSFTVIISDMHFPDYLLETLQTFVKVGKIRDFHIYPELAKIGNGYQISELVYEKLQKNRLNSSLKDAISSIKNKFFSSKHEFIKNLSADLTSDEFKLNAKKIVKLSKKTHLKTHIAIRKIINKLDNQSFDLIILNYDNNLMNRFLLDLAKTRKIFSVNLCPYSMSQVIQFFLNSDANLTKKYSPILPVNKPIYFDATKEKNGESLRENWRKTLKKYSILRKLNQLVNEIRVFRKDFFREYLYEVLLNKKVFYSGKLVRICFASGLSDFTVCYDPLEIEALKFTVPAVQNIQLLQHPSSGLCRCDGRKSSNRLLVLFSNHLDSELSGEKFHRWTNAINQIVRIAKTTEIHLRLHPRTSSGLNWPKKLKESCQLPGGQIKIMQGLRTPINESICDYSGVLGTPSASLRVARVSCPHMFVLGMTNCGDGAHGNHEYMVSQKWSLGFGEGIEFVSENGPIMESQIKIPTLAYRQRKTVSEFLNELLRYVKN